MKKNFSIKKITGIAILTSFSLITFMIESLFPPIFIPGSKMGLSNIFVLLAIILYGNMEGILLVIIKTLLGSIFIGNISSIMYSLSAGIVSAITEIILIKFVMPHISVISVSIIAAVIHNTVQNLIYSLVVNSTMVLVYLPYLALIGIISGLLVGLATFYIIKYLPEKTVYKYIDSENK